MMAIVNYAEQRIDRHGDRGFTLLEVMIALVIMGTALVALLSLANRSIGVRSEVQRVTHATLLAEQKMTEVETFYQLGRGREIENEGVFEEPFEVYRWEIAFADTMLPSIQQVNVMVRWGPIEKSEYVEINSFVFRESAL
ncbi:type IV pilus modification PilV family protein [Geoalkalibacter subterraneus]|uniref:type IV pilus modification PilV family protein n=1 Tax=Geoalkalibacter subterraneus TaxID=483547 RepID=UPI0009FFDADD|nr:prepilin-type N-terminal cleavage/methylation domain-containing protein [Geoalkalibacter subterraneus]